MAKKELSHVEKMKAHEEAENAKRDAQAEAIQKRMDDEAAQREATEYERFKSQVEAGSVPESQWEATSDKTHLTEADMSDEDVVKDKAEVDPQFAGKHVKEKLEELPVAPLTADEQDKVVQADQEIRAALTAKEQGIPDIPNAEGEDAEVVEGVKESREAAEELAEDEAKAQADNAKKADKADEADKK
jgi:hypothetical protein